MRPVGLALSRFSLSFFRFSAKHSEIMCNNYKLAGIRDFVLCFHQKIWVLDWNCQLDYWDWLWDRTEGNMVLTEG